MNHVDIEWDGHNRKHQAPSTLIYIKAAYSSHDSDGTAFCQATGVPGVVSCSACTGKSLHVCGRRVLCSQRVWAAHSWGISGQFGVPMKQASTNKARTENHNMFGGNGCGVRVLDSTQHQVCNRRVRPSRYHSTIPGARTTRYS
jgi:hypothetical protein